MEISTFLKKSDLGKSIEYKSTYNSKLLLPIPRSLGRTALNLNEKNLFYGYDLWNHYEISWLNNKGKPMVAIAEIIFDCHTTHLIESKSLKLYFNSLNNTQFADIKTLNEVVKKDLEKEVGGLVVIKIKPLDKHNNVKAICGFDGICLDNIDIDCSDTLQIHYFCK